MTFRQATPASGLRSARRPGARDGGDVAHPRGPAFLILYAAMTGLLALYLAYFSGEGLRWPWLAAGSAFAPYAWNVPLALSGVMASLFAREIADLRPASPRVHGGRSGGWRRHPAPWRSRTSSPHREQRGTLLLRLRGSMVASAMAVLFLDLNKQ